MEDQTNHPPKKNKEGRRGGAPKKKNDPCRIKNDHVVRQPSQSIIPFPSQRDTRRNTKYTTSLRLSSEREEHICSNIGGRESGGTESAVYDGCGGTPAVWERLKLQRWWYGADETMPI